MNFLTKKTMIKATLIFSSVCLTGQLANAEPRSVGPVHWNTAAPATINTAHVPHNMSQLVFIRFNDSLPVTESTNIAIDDDYQISLDSNHLSQVFVCAGNHLLSSQTTANKSNDLEYNTQTVTTRPKQTYYYGVKALGQGRTDIVPLNDDAQVGGQPLSQYIENIPRQTHQISRVVPNCPETVYKPIVVTAPIVLQPAPTPKPAPKPIPKPAPKPLPVIVATPIEFNKPIELDVLFNYDSATVVPQYYTRIAEMSEFLRDNNASAIIEGHTDSRGDEGYNMRLSQRRADAVKTLMVNEYGVNPAQLTTQGFGETQPVASNNTDAGRQQNRRVVAIAIKR